MHQVDDRLYRIHEFVQLRFIDDERECDFENHEVVSADLTVYRLVAKEAHHQHLSKHRWMYFRKCFKQNSLANLPRRAELDARHHSESPYLFDHLIVRQTRDQFLAKLSPQSLAALAQVTVR